MSNVVWQLKKVGLEDREERNGHKAFIVWFTGLPAAGKTTLSFRLEQALFARGIQTFSLDGDNLRHGLNRDLGFQQADRKENIRRVGELSKLFMQSGQVVLSSFVSPYRLDRMWVRELVPAGRFVEVFVDCSLDECERRDPKGHYKRAKAGEIKDYTGISAPYEVPERPEIHLNTEHHSLQENISTLMQYLEEKTLISKSSL